MLMMSAEKAEELGYQPLVKYIGAASTALDPSIMGYAPVSAVEKLEKKTGISRYDVGLYELNEAFAAQAAACNCQRKRRRRSLRPCSRMHRRQNQLDFDSRNEKKRREIRRGFPLHWRRPGDGDDV